MASPDPAGKTARRAVLSSVNPFTGQKMKDYLEMAPEDVERAISNAQERFTDWRTERALLCRFGTGRESVTGGTGGGRGPGFQPSPRRQE